MRFPCWIRECVEVVPTAYRPCRILAPSREDIFARGACICFAGCLSAHNSRRALLVFLFALEIYPPTRYRIMVRVAGSKTYAGWGKKAARSSKNMLIVSPKLERVRGQFSL